MIPRVRKRPLALPRRGLKLLLPHLERLRPHLVLDPDLLQALARGVVLVLRTLRCERKCRYPLNPSIPPFSGNQIAARSVERSRLRTLVFSCECTANVVHRE